MIMTKEELDTIIKNHQHWLNQDCEGWEKMKADFHGIFLRGIDLKGANLAKVDFKYLVLLDASLSDADLTGTNLKNTDLRYANLNHADLTKANLENANLEGANLSGANLSGANLKNANLRFANLTMANLVGANLEDIVGDFANFALATGINNSRRGEILTTDLIGYKKCTISRKKCENEVTIKFDVIVKLLIPRGAVVFSINDKKCRTNKVKVLEIEGADRAYAWYGGMSYYVGDEITVYDFDCQYNTECAKGIHFFKSREEAINF